MMKTLFGYLRKDERGVSGVEFALLVPLLLAVLLGTVTLFDLFRTAQTAEKSTFSVGDMLSRETALTTSQLNAMLTFLENTVPVSAHARLRVSSISNKAGKLTLDWSKNVGNSSVQLDTLSYALIPDIAVGDSVILTESYLPYRAFISGFGFDAFTFNNKAVHRPRFVGRIVFQ